MYELARPAPPLGHSPDRAGAVPRDLVDLLDAWATTPALVQNRRLDVLASNALARALTPALLPGANSLRATFLDPEQQARYTNLRLTQARVVAYLRGKVGHELDDPLLAELIDELTRESADFGELWPRHDVLAVGATGDTGFEHPVVGTIRLRYSTFNVSDAEGLTLLVYHAVPGGDDARALTLLQTLTADLDGENTATT